MTHLPFQLLLARFALKRTHSQRVGFIAVLVLVSLALAGCAESGQMAEQPRYDPLEASQFFADGKSAQQLPEGVVPFAKNEGQSVFSQEEGQPLSPNSPVLTGLDADGNPVQGFPLPVDQDLAILGQERYNIFCVPCHGPTGEGNGVAVQFGVMQPPSLLTSTLTSGDLFTVITEGKGQMYPYGYRVQPEERWAIIAYVRAMQLKGGPAEPASLTPAELQSIEGQP